VPIIRIRKNGEFMQDMLGALVGNIGIRRCTRTVVSPEGRKVVPPSSGCALPLSLGRQSIHAKRILRREPLSICMGSCC
jgi:hypothetical protein